jgi:mono/diheme cytochrome c family protein
MRDTQENIPAYTLDPKPPRLGRVPTWMISGGLILVVGSWVPLVLFARARASTSNLPRVQFMQDMGTQPKYREQQSSEVFADGRADRPVIEGTVARGHLDEDDHYFRGYGQTVGADGKPQVKFFEGFPQQVKLDMALLKRGQERFNIYCSVCHGLDGYGHGATNERALELQRNARGTAWTQAADLTKDPVKSRPEGHIYNTINVGIRNMPPYGPQIPVHDRWAIVAYLRALQLSTDVPSRDVPPEVIDAAKASR